MSNAIRYDSLLVHYLARELHHRLRGRRLRGVRLDSDARRFTLELDGERLVWELHPLRGWIRVVDAGRADPLREAAEGWGGRRIRTQRRPRVRRVAAPTDERWIEIEIDAGGPDRASRFVVELMTNQWNVLALGPDGTIVSVLRAREAGGRALRTGAPYTPPGAGDRPPREGAAGPVTAERWHELLSATAPEERQRTLVRTLAWTSTLNAAAILGAAADQDDDAALTDAWRRYDALARRPDPQPQLLDLGRTTPYPLPLPGVDGRPVDSLLDALEHAVGAEGTRTLAPEVRAALESRLAHAAALVDRLEAEAAAAPDKAARLRQRADLLMAQLHRVGRGDRVVELDDFAGGTTRLELDPALSAAENAQALYDRARKRERAAARLPARIRQAVAERERLAALMDALERGAADATEAARWMDEVRPEDSGGGADESRLPYRAFRSSGGLEIRVGRSGRANDDLTFRHSGPDDVWLHARDTAGAHVILRWPQREQNPPKRDLLEAAVLAAVHSRARTSGTVPVDWTRRKHVRKPRKAPPGTVIPGRVETLFVEPDPSIVDRLSDQMK